MKPDADLQLLDQLRTEENSAFELLYKFYFPSILSYVKRNMGSREDAEDIFQESIIVLLQKSRSDDFVLTSSLKTYLYAIAKNLWLKRLKTNKLISVEDFEQYQKENDSFAFELHTEKPQEEKVASWLERITEHCRHVIKALFFFQEPMESLMQKMGWKNKHTADNQKYKCIQQVKREQQKDT